MSHAPLYRRLLPPDGAPATPFGALPYPLLACPLLHLFHHRGHRSHRGHGSRGGHGPARTRAEERRRPRQRKQIVNEAASAFGLWSLVIINSPVFIIFALSFGGDDVRVKIRSRPFNLLSTKAAADAVIGKGAISMNEQLWVECVGDLIVARMRGAVTAEVLNECQERVVALAHESGM